MDLHPESEDNFFLPRGPSMGWCLHGITNCTWAGRRRDRGIPGIHPRSRMHVYRTAAEKSGSYIFVANLPFSMLVDNSVDNNHNTV